MRMIDVPPHERVYEFKPGQLVIMNFVEIENECRRMLKQNKMEEVKFWIGIVIDTFVVTEKWRDENYDKRWHLSNGQRIVRVFSAGTKYNDIIKNDEDNIQYWHPSNLVAITE